ncbi:MAG: hypothetical protein J5967_04535 [Oscillospiraceae bacterium]|nr:hypothetical protein [Oscillospiraceae bacterium]
MTIVEQAAYLKGLTEGLGIEPESRDGKLWGALTELLSDMAHEIEDLQASNLDFADALDEVCEDLAYLEEVTCDLDPLPEDLDEDFEDSEDEDSYHFSGEEITDSDDGGYDGVLYDVTCPACGEEITFDEDTLDEGSIRCPACGEVLEFDLGENGDGEDDGDDET